MNCPKCNFALDPAAIRREAARMAGSVKSPARAAASRANGAKSGAVRWEVWGPDGLVTLGLPRGLACAQAKACRDACADGRVFSVRPERRAGK